MLDPELLLLAMNTADEGIVIAEQEGSDNVLIYANQAFERLTGYSVDEILYQDCRFLQGNDRDQEGLDEIRDALREKRACRSIVRNYRKDGSPFWNELSITPVFNEADQLTYFIGIQRDVSALVAMQEENRRLKRRLAELTDKPDPRA
jgi:PAS domain S-box-containing protein